MPPAPASENMPHILVVDNDDGIRALLPRYLRENGFAASTARDAAQALDILQTILFDALVVDVMMPGMDGLAFTRAVRRDSAVPVLLLTALGEAEDRIAGLECGADDYLAKPFEPRELVLRLKAILRRGANAAVSAAAGFRVGRWDYDPAYAELRCGEERVRLTPVEDNLLRALAARAGEAVSREDLAALCGPEAGERTIDVQVTRLRRKIEDDPKAPRCLLTARGKGYLLRIGDGP